MDRLIPIVADEHADPEQGSGAVKITPAHDFNDFEVGKRHDLPMINILDQHGCINEEAPERYQGLDRFEARKLVLKEFEELGLLEKTEDHVLQVPYGDRSDVVIEPWLTDQWYVNAEVLAQPAIKAVEDGTTTFVPKNWEKTYYEWMRNIQPWCISRQLWWGHQIPAWYGPDGETFVAETEEAAAAAAKEHYGRSVELKRDEDVLDTWFSSALWPFSTLGWPEDTPQLEKFYKTDVLVTGFDIIFFWVARMMMMGLHFKEEVPFHTVYIHALVRDEKGAKMSKSKGNVIDPLELIDEFGADALRFTLIAMAAQGRDIKLSKQRVEGYRNFGTKLWNASRFCEMNECVRIADFDPKSVSLTVNKWIIGDTARTSKAISEAIDAYRFNEAAGAVYRFVWNVFCDWYVEFIKPVFNGANVDEQAETRACAAWVLDEILKMLHPFMPFITEELWQKLAENGEARQDMLIRTKWADLDEGFGNADSDREMDWVIRFVSEVRSVRSEMNIPAGAKIPLTLKSASDQSAGYLEQHNDVIKFLARLESAKLSDEVPEGAIQAVLDEATIIIPVADVIDVAQEITRIQKEIDKTEKEITKFEKKLGNAGFLAKAPEHVIEEQKTRKAEAEEMREKYREALKRLESVS